MRSDVIRAEHASYAPKTRGCCTSRDKSSRNSLKRDLSLRSPPPPLLKGVNRDDRFNVATRARISRLYRTRHVFAARATSARAHQHAQVTFMHRALIFIGFTG